jgi:hypothetical protein
VIAWGRRTGSHAVSARQIGARELGGRRIHRKADPAAIKGDPAPVEGRQRRRAQVSRGARGGIYGSRIGQRGALGVSGKTPGAYPNRRRRAHAAGRERPGLRRALAGTQRSAHKYHGRRDKRFHPNLRASPCRDIKLGLRPVDDNRIGSRLRSSRWISPFVLGLSIGWPVAHKIGGSRNRRHSTQVLYGCRMGWGDLLPLRSSPQGAVGAPRPWSNCLRRRGRFAGRRIRCKGAHAPARTCPHETAAARYGAGHRSETATARAPRPLTTSALLCLRMLASARTEMATPRGAVAAR